MATIVWNWSFDGWMIVHAILCALSCSLVGNFLVLRGTSLLGDAISHSILPGLALAFWFTGSRSGPEMFLAALAAAVVTVFLIEGLRNATRMDQGAAMGVVFTALFALGIVLIVQVADHVDLDPNCVLYGSLELTPLDRWDIGGWLIPKAAVTLGVTLLLNGLFVGLFYKELLLTTFDSAFADSVGFSSRLVHYLLMILVAFTAVASFESVGSVLVIAMLVVPTSAALLITDRLGAVIGWSAGLAALAAGLGHVSAVVVPTWWGYGSTLTSGMMAVAAGGLLLLCGLFGPRRGLLVRWWQQRLFAAQVAADDVLAYLFRLGEQSPRDPATLAQIGHALPLSSRSLHRAVKRLCRTGELDGDESGYRLSAAGRRRAQDLVRSHRLWELYLVEQAQIAPSRIHDKAEAWEHVTDQTLRARLDQATSDSKLDPHGSAIPPEASERETDPPR
jgi:manganese/zinc/iron transport system permease protein